MPKILCPNKIDCPGGGNLEFDSPLANFSSQQPDQDIFFGFSFGWDINFPPIGDGFGDPRIPGWCESAISQDDANLCALKVNFQHTVGGGPFGGGWTDPNGNPVVPVGCDLTECSYTCPDGSLFTWTILPGSVVSFNKALANQIAQSLACNLARLRHVCLPSLQTACLNIGYQGIISPTGTAPFQMAIVSGALPPGLSFSQTSIKTGIISGVPTQAGSFTFTLLVSDANGNMMQKVYTLGVMGLAAQPAAGTVGSPYSFQLQINGGQAPFTFSFTSGALPDGLTMTDSGLISGTPTAANSNSAILLVTDASGAKCDQVINFNIATSGFKVCNWPVVRASLDFAGAGYPNAPLGQTEWDGTMTLKNTNGVNDNPAWYFIGQGITGNAANRKAVSADLIGPPNYPNGDWPDNCWTGLAFSGGAWFFLVAAASATCAFANQIAWVNGNGNPNDPTGTYTLAFNSGMGASPVMNIVIEQIGGVPCCPDFSKMQWTAPVITLGNPGGTGSASASGNSLQASGTTGAASCTDITGMFGSLNYTGPAWDAYIILNVSQFTTDAANTQCAFIMAYGAGQLAHVRFGSFGGGNQIIITDADGTRTLNGQLPGTFTIHVHGSAGVNVLISMQGDTGVYLTVCPGGNPIAFNLLIGC